MEHLSYRNPLRVPRPVVDLVFHPPGLAELVSRIVTNGEIGYPGSEPQDCKIFPPCCITRARKPLWRVVGFRLG